MKITKALVATLLLSVTSISTASAAPKHVLIYGDSITWGWLPQANAIPTVRLPDDQQWPSVVKAALGPDVQIEVDALSGRTTDIADPSFPGLTGAGLNGSASLPAVIAAHLPLDLVVIMLGTNDAKKQFNRTPFRIALGAGNLINIVQSSANMFGGGWYSYPAPKVLLVCPPMLGKQGVMGDAFEGGEARTKAMPKEYAAIATAAGESFFDAGTAVQTDGVDGVHLTADGERKLGEALVAPIRDALK